MSRTCWLSRNNPYVWLQALRGYSNARCHSCTADRHNNGVQMGHLCHRKPLIPEELMHQAKKAPFCFPRSRTECSHWRIACRRGPAPETQGPWCLGRRWWARSCRAEPVWHQSRSVSVLRCFPVHPPSVHNVLSSLHSPRLHPPCTAHKEPAHQSKFAGSYYVCNGHSTHNSAQDQQLSMERQLHACGASEGITMCA